MGQNYVYKVGSGRISGIAGLSGEKSRISGIIRQGSQGMPDNPARYQASGKKNQIRPNPSIKNRWAPIKRGQEEVLFSWGGRGDY